MKRATDFAVALLVLCLAVPTVSAEDDAGVPAEFPVLTGPYLGQKPPGTSPVIFASEILVKPKQAHSNIVFSEAGTEAYWCHNGIWYAKLEGGRWTEPRMVPFSTEAFSDDAPFLSPDGRRLFFASKRPMVPSDTTRKENLWAVDIEADGWSDAKPLPPVVNDAFQHWQASVDRQGNLYYGRWLGEAAGGNKDVYVSRYANGVYREPEPLAATVNSEHKEGNPYISPDGDYLVFTRIGNERLPDGLQDVSLWVSFRLLNDSWSRPIDLRHYLGSQHSANCAFVSQDGKYLFFLDIYEGRYQRYWISAEIIDEVRASHPERENFRPTE